jgi:hypothetical protein
VSIHEAMVERMSPAESTNCAAVLKIDRDATGTAATASRGDDACCGRVRGVFSS